MIVEGYEIKPGANLSGANLSYADLRDAILRGADLRDANLRGANLRGANLYGVNLYGANLRSAILYDADLCDADLRYALLRSAVLSGADLYGADLRDADLPDFQLCPQEGEFVGYKKVDSGVIKLLVPKEAKRTSSLVGRKCRAEYVKVLEGSGVSRHGGRYVEGEIYRPDSYNDDIRVECTNGVHFFMTIKEAEEWRY